MEGKIKMKVPHKSTDGDDSFDVRFSGVLDDRLQSRNLVLDGKDFLQLFAVLHHDDVGLPVQGAMQTRLGRIRSVNASGETTVKR
jgi:hypothetical protein